MSLEFTEEEQRNFKEAIFGKLPDGDYSGRLVDVEIAERKYRTGESSRTLDLTYQIDAPEDLKGTDYTHSLSFKTKAIAGYSKFVLSQFGLDVSGLSLMDVSDQLLKKINTKVFFTLYENGKYQNCKLIMTEESLTEKDDIPF